MLAASSNGADGEQLPGAAGADNPERRRLALQTLIHRRLILQEADRRKFSVAQGDLDGAVVSLRRRFADLTSFGEWMHQQAVDERSLFDHLRANMLVARTTAAIVADVRVSKQATREYYEKHQDELRTEDVWIQMIVVGDGETAAKIRTALDQGEDFGVLAQRWSLGRRAAQRGDVGWVNSEALWPPVRHAVQELQPGEAIGPLPRGDDEFLIVRLEKRRAGRTKTFAEAQPEIESRLLAARQSETIRAWLVDQEEKAEINVYLQPY